MRKIFVKSLSDEKKANYGISFSFSCFVFVIDFSHMKRTHTLKITKPKVYILFHEQRTKLRLTGQIDVNNKDI